MSQQNRQISISRRSFVVGGLAAAGAVGSASTLAAESSDSRRSSLERVRVAQIGMQGHFGDIVHGIEKDDSCDLVAIARSWPEEDIEDMRKFAAVTEHTKIYDDPMRMLDEVKPDVVAVFTPYAHNGRFNIAAVERSCHVISEKPIANTLDELEHLRKARDKAGVRLTAMLPMRLHPGLAAAHYAVNGGRIGEPLLISAQKTYKWGKNRPWYFKHREDYGGSIPWVGIHAIDFIRFVTGLEFKSVTARQAVMVHKDYPDCADCGALLFEMDNGGQATLTFDYLRPETAPSHGDDRLRVAGREGIVEVRLTNKTFCEIMTQKEPPAQLPLPESRINTFLNFVNSIRGNEKHYLTPEDPFTSTAVALKARLAANTQKTVTI